ncbi:hypothetical protein Q0M94_02335 [Deinococcus radiomollis]|uniref:hypothetical protein n=1 Tax=Deinococcus radiomollis TaxID=468916 RepID=UPI0038913347
MTFLITCCIGLGLYVMRSTSPRVFLHPGTYRAPQVPYWPDEVPVSERYESVTVIDPQRTTQIVEVMGTRREVLYMEALK